MMPSLPNSDRAPNSGPTKMAKLRSALLAATLACTTLGAAQPSYAQTDRDYMGDALDYVEQRDLKSAVISLKNALQETPDDVEARYMLGDIYLKLGFGEGAEKEFEQAVKLGLDQESVLFSLGKAILIQGDFHRVLSDIHMSNDLPQSVRAEVMTLHALAELGLNNIITAKGMLQDALDLYPGLPDALVGLARIDMNDDKLDKAMGHLDEALASDPDCMECWILRGEIARKEKDFYRARDDFQAALDIEPTNFLAHIGSAAASVELQEWELAKNHLAESNKIRPNQPLANYLSAVIAFQEGDMETAQIKLQEALRSMPNHLPSLLLSGTVNYATGQYTQAQTQLSQYVSENPNNVHARKMLASTELKLKDPQRALSVLRGAQELAPEDAQLAELIGNAYMQAGEYEKGTAVIEKAMESSPDSAELQTQLALSKLASGRDESAIKDLQSALEKNPEKSSRADVLLILAHMKNRKFQDAVNAAQSLAAKLPENPVPYNLLGAAYMAEGNHTEARLAFEQAVELKPDFTVAHLNLARLDVAAGDLISARERLNLVLDFDKTNGNAMLEMAKLAGLQGDRQGALIWLERAWSGPTKNRPVGLMLGRSYLENQEPDKALVVVTELNEAIKADPDVKVLLAETQMAVGESASAINTYRELVDLKPNNPDTHMLLAQALLRTGNSSGALNTVRDAARQFPDSTRIKGTLAQLLLQNGQVKEARAAIAEIKRKNPDDPLGYKLQGDLFVRDKNLADALASYQKAFEVRPSSALVTQIHRVKREMDGVRAALPPLKEWLEKHPKDSDVRLMLAIAYSELDDPFGAIREYRAAIDANPRNFVALNNLALLLEKENNPTAIDYARRAHEVNPGSPAAGDTYGWMLVESGRAAEAVPILASAMRNARNVPEVRYHYAFALYQAGDFKKAKRELQRLVLLKQDFPGKQDAKVLLKELRRAIPKKSSNSGKE